MDELIVLEQAARTLDLVEVLRAELTGADLVVRVSQGQPAAHPLLGELRQARGLLAQHFRRLGFNDVDDEGRDLPSARHQRSAQARWARRAPGGALMARGRRRERPTEPSHVDPRLRDAHVEDWVDPSEVQDLTEATQLAGTRWSATCDELRRTEHQAGPVTTLYVTQNRADALAGRGDGTPITVPTSALMLVAIAKSNAWALGDRMPFRDEGSFTTGMTS